MSFITWGLVVMAALVTLRVTPAHAQYVEQGRVGSPESWQSEEFKKDWGLGAIGAQHAYAAGLSGKGVKVGALDSGFYAQHPEFAQRFYPVRAQGTYISGLAFDIDGKINKRNDGHGTHVTGTIAAARDGVGMHGVAFGADMLVANTNENDGFIFGPHPDTNYFQAVYDALTQSGVRLINNSWGSQPADVTYKSLQALTQAYEQHVGKRTWLDAAQDVARRGVIQVFSAGNSGYQFASARASLPYFQPDLEGHWLAVNGSDKKGKVTYNHCGVAKFWCVAAPSKAIYSTYSPVTKRAEEVLYKSSSGTSMAAPHASGALALIMERFPYMTNAQALQVLLTTASQDPLQPDQLSAAPNIEIGWGVVNLKNALAGPAQLLGRFQADLHEGMQDTWSHDISDKALALRQTEDAAEQQTWAQTLRDKDWENGLPEGASEAERNSYTLGTARAAAAQARVYQGSLLKTGRGTLVLSGHNTYRGDTVIQDGQLVVNGTLASDVSIQKGATLSGSGSVQSWTAHAGSTVAPGNSVGTLKATGDIHFARDSVYAVEVSPAGSSDHLAVAGKAHLQGGIVQVSLENTPTLLNAQQVESLHGKQFSILSADDGIKGQFQAVLPNTLFVATTLDYGPHAVQLKVQRNATTFASLARNANQSQTATALESLGLGNPLYESLLTLQNPSAAPQTFQQLSGEIYPAVAAALIDHERHPRLALIDRLRSADSTTNGAWAQWLGAKTHLASDGNAHAVRHSTQGVLVGADRQLNAALRAGVVAGLNQSHVKIAALQSTAANTSQHLGAYAGYRQGAWGLRLGSLYGRHHSAVNRTVALGGSISKPSATLRGETTQTITDIGYQLEAGKFTLEPFFNYAVTSYRQKKFVERGGAVALQGSQQKTSGHTATLGLRGALQFDLAAERKLSLNGLLGWQHQTGGKRASTLSFAAGGLPFTQTTASAGSQAALLEASAQLQLHPQLQLGLAYSTLLNQRKNDHALKARLHWQF